MRTLPPSALWIFCIAAFAAADRVGAAVIHVAPGGLDSHPGTAMEPMASLEAARNALRRVESGAERTILLHDGAYYNVSLQLEPEDSGLVVEAAPDARPVLYGGRILNGWEREGERFWSAPLDTLPEAEAAGPPRALLIRDALAPRARFPAEGRLTHLTAFDVPWMSSTGGGWKRQPTAEELTTLRYRPGDLGEWLRTTNAEITVYHMWDESCVGIASHEPTENRLVLSPTPGHPPGAFGVREYVLWNIAEGMSRPGQWYHDRTRNRIVLWPESGEDPRQMRVIVPVTQAILRLSGSRDRPVERVVVRGLTLAGTTVPLEAGGFAAANFDGAISLSDARDCRFDQLDIHGVAGHAINARRSAVRISVTRCRISDCGAGGIYVGGDHPLIEDNLVCGIGRQHAAAIGIFRGGRGGVVRHNEVFDCSYSAINYGGTGNLVENNLIHDCMKTLHDGAAIYLFAATNCTVRGNLARDIIDTGGYGASAYYLDERSTGCIVENNVSLRVARPLHCHMTTNNVIRNNVLLVEGDARLTFPRSNGLILDRNILLATGSIRIENLDGVLSWNRNLFHSGTGRIEAVRQQGYSSRETIPGAPGDTVTEDPRMDRWLEGDFSWPADSPPARIGINPVDVRRAGVRR